MTPQEFRAARHALGLTQAELAHVLNAGLRTLTRWEAGQGWINPQAVRIMQWLAEGYRPAEWPRQCLARRR